MPQVLFIAALAQRARRAVVVGTALVWVPIALGLFLAGHTLKALILVALGLGVISVIDNLLRPIYARMGSLKMPMVLLFVAVFGGLAAFGTWGALIGPLLVRLAMEALALSKGDTPAPSEAPASSAAPAP